MGLQINVERLKTYLGKLKIFPKGSGKKAVKQGDTPKSQLENVAQNTLKEIIPIPKPTLRIKSRAITADEKSESYSAYKKMQKARIDLKFLGAKMKKAKVMFSKAALKAAPCTHLFIAV